MDLDLYTHLYNRVSLIGIITVLFAGVLWYMYYSKKSEYLFNRYKNYQKVKCVYKNLSDFSSLN